MNPPNPNQNSLANSPNNLDLPFKLQHRYYRVPLDHVGLKYAVLRVPLSADHTSPDHQDSCVSPVNISKNLKDIARIDPKTGTLPICPCCRPDGKQVRKGQLPKAVLNHPLLWRLMCAVHPDLPKVNPPAQKATGTQSQAIHASTAQRPVAAAAKAVHPHFQQSGVPTGLQESNQSSQQTDETVSQTLHRIGGELNAAESFLARLKAEEAIISHNLKNTLPPPQIRNRPTSHTSRDQSPKPAANTPLPRPASAMTNWRVETDQFGKAFKSIDDPIPNVEKFLERNSFIEKNNLYSKPLPPQSSELYPPPYNSALPSFEPYSYIFDKKDYKVQVAPKLPPPKSSSDKVEFQRYLFRQIDPIQQQRLQEYLVRERSLNQQRNLQRTTQENAIQKNTANKRTVLNEAFQRVPQKQRFLSRSTQKHSLQQNSLQKGSLQKNPFQLQAQHLQMLPQSPPQAPHQQVPLKGHSQEQASPQQTLNKVPQKQVLQSQALAKGAPQKPSLQPQLPQPQLREQQLSEKKLVEQQLSEKKLVEQQPSAQQPPQQLFKQQDTAQQQSWHPRLRNRLSPAHPTSPLPAQNPHISNEDKAKQPEQDLPAAPGGTWSRKRKAEGLSITEARLAKQREGSRRSSRLGGAQNNK